MDEHRITRRVLMAELSGGRVRGRPRLGWMDGVKVAFGQQRNDCGGCSTMLTKLGNVPCVGAYLNSEMCRVGAMVK